MPTKQECKKNCQGVRCRLSWFYSCKWKNKECKIHSWTQSKQEKEESFKAKLKKWIKDNRNLDIIIFMKALNRKLIGTNNCISGAYKEDKALYSHAMRVT